MVMHLPELSHLEVCLSYLETMSTNWRLMSVMHFSGLHFDMSQCSSVAWVVDRLQCSEESWDNADITPAARDGSSESMKSRALAPRIRATSHSHLLKTFTRVPNCHPHALQRLSHHDVEKEGRGRRATGCLQSSRPPSAASRETG